MNVLLRAKTVRGVTWRGITRLVLVFVVALWGAPAVPHGVNYGHVLGVPARCDVYGRSRLRPAPEPVIEARIFVMDFV